MIISTLKIMKNINWQFSPATQNVLLTLKSLLYGLFLTNTGLTLAMAKSYHPDQKASTFEKAAKNLHATILEWMIIAKTLIERPVPDAQPPKIFKT
jgi:hypothetical protein